MGIALSLGVATGSLAWSIAAAAGLAAIMASSAWTLQVLRYVGAGYLMFMAFKSTRSALSGPAAIAQTKLAPSTSRSYGKGLALHLTNPKPILFFGSLYTLGISAETSRLELVIVIAAIGLQNLVIFAGYAWLFSNDRVARRYARLRRWFDVTFAAIFAGARLQVLIARQ